LLLVRRLLVLELLLLLLLLLLMRLAFASDRCLLYRAIALQQAAVFADGRG
jgi:hypothetical protein